MKFHTEANLEQMKVFVFIAKKWQQLCFAVCTSDKTHSRNTVMLSHSARKTLTFSKWTTSLLNLPSIL